MAETFLMQNCHLFNLTELQRRQGSPLFLEFYGGDITKLPADVILISAFQNAYEPTPGSVFGAIDTKYGQAFLMGRPPQAISLADDVWDFGVSLAPDFERLWVVDISTYATTNTELTEIFQLCLRRLCRLAPYFDHLGIQTLSLPLLGTGSQGIPYAEAAAGLLEVVKAWRDSSTSLRRVRIFAYDLEAVATLNLAIDRDFRAGELPNHIDPLLIVAQRTLADEISCYGDYIHLALGEMLALLQVPAPSLKSVAVAGRVLAEVCASLLYQQVFPGSAVTFGLHRKLGRLQRHLSGSKPWVMSHFRLLQACGNKAAHPDWGKVVLTARDIALVVFAALQVAEFTKQQLSSVELLPATGAESGQLLQFLA